MKKNIFFISIFLLSCYGTCHAQLDTKQLQRTVTLTLEDLLDLRLKILAAQMSCGSFYILDMGSVGFPVSIEIGDSLGAVSKRSDKRKVVFRIRGRFNDRQLSRDEQKELIEQSMAIVDVGISQLFEYDFRQLGFDRDKYIVGYWYFSEASYPSAKWENGEFRWLK